MATDMATPVTDGVIRVTVGDTTHPTMVEAGVVEVITQVIHPTQLIPVMEVVITPTDKDVQPIQMLAEVVEAEVQQELPHRIQETVDALIQ